jgi:hypothetical protein
VVVGEVVDDGQDEPMISEGKGRMTHIGVTDM